MARVRFYFDFTSPFTYLASTQIDALAARTGATIDYVPVLLGAILKATGNQPPAMLPARAIYLQRDLPRWAEFYGVPFNFSPFFPLKSLGALRGACALKVERPEAFHAYVHASFRAAWVDGKDLGDPAELGRIAGEHGELVVRAAETEAWKDALKRATDEAVAAGAFGAPTFVMEDGEMFFGNDRLGLLEWTLGRRRAGTG
jgi:2-hydroxychromene-2-carboxylate isomerase